MTRPSGTGVERQTAPQRSEGGRELEQTPLPSSPEAGPNSGFNLLQRTIGNRATARLVQRQRRGGPAAPSTDAGARAEFELGRVAYEHGRYDEALRHFETVTRSPGLDPARMPLLVWNLALTRAHLGDIDGAMTEAATYGQSATTRPASQLIAEIARIAAPRSGGPQAAPAAAPSTDAEARAAFELGRRAYESGRFDEARRQFESARQSPGLDPARMPLLVWNLALTRAHLGDIDGALTEAMDYGQLGGALPPSQLIAEIERIGAEQSRGRGHRPRRGRARRRAP